MRAFLSLFQQTRFDDGAGGLVGNGLQQAIRQRRINLAERNEAFDLLTKLNIVVDAETNEFAWTSTIELADRFRLTTYDSSYLELAQRRGLPLATLDQDMRSAGKKLGIPLL